MNLKPHRQAWLSKDQEQTIYGECLKDNYKGDSRSHIIYLVKQVDRKSLKFSLRTTSPAIAYRTANKKLKEKLQINAQDSTKFKTLILDEVERYKEHRLRDVDAGDLEHDTYRIINTNLTRYAEFFGSEFVEVLEQENFQDKWDEFISDYKKKYPTHGLFNMVKYTRALFIFMHERGAIRRRPLYTVRGMKAEKIKSQKKKDKIYSAEEIEALFNSTTTPRDKAILSLMYYLGFRISDALELEWSRINFDEQDPYVAFAGEDKESKWIKVPMPDVVRISLLEWGGLSTPTHGFVFPQKQNPAQHLKPQQFDFHVIRVAAKVEWGTPHTLRHTRLTLDFGNPKLPQAMIMKFRRVSMEVALEHYIHPNQEHRELFRTMPDRLGVVK